ncbi:MAG: DUF2357 domain-containing protein, partial [Methyloprofundus sp.]|nr:DUF2357 domain-containing protein [Methyloprofundus sp.]
MATEKPDAEFYVARRGKVGGGLVIVNLIFSNNLGWFSLPFRYVKNGMTIEQSQSFEVWPFELLWLAEFKSLHEQMQKGYKQILNAPHNRLLPEVAHLKAERLKDKLPNKLAEKARADIQAGLVNRRYALDQKRLSLDIPENQFMKYALNAVSQKLEQIKQKVRVLDNAVAKQDKVAVFSDAFYKNLDALIAPYQKFKRFPLFKEVS